MSEWKETLPEDIREWDEVKNAEEPEAFWEQVKNMRSRLGRSLTIPSEDAGEEDRKAFLEKLQKHVPDLIPAPKDPESFDTVLKMLGKPEDPDEYKLPELQAPEGVNIDEERIANFKQLAHEAGLTQRQFEALLAKYMENEFQTLQQVNETEQTKLNELKQEWGATFDEKVQQANAIREQFFPYLPEQLTAETIKSFVQLAEALGSEPNGSFQGIKQSDILTPDEAALQLSEIYRNRQHPYWNPRDPAHTAAKARVRQLIKWKLGSQE